MIEKSKKEISHHIAHVSKSKAGKKIWPGSYRLVLKSLSSSFRPVWVTVLAFSAKTPMIINGYQ